MSEVNKELMRRFAEKVVNAHDLSAADQLVDVNVIEHGRGLESGLAGFKQGMEMFFAAFPDLTMTIEDLIAEHDKVVARSTFRGTHQGTFMGLDPTGRKFKVTAIDVVRFADGKAIEHWGLTDRHSLLEQLGGGDGEAAPQN